MSHAEDIAWQNGHILPFRSAAVPVADLGVVAGATISEMARTCNHRPFRLATHADRLLESCEELEFPQDWSRDEIIKATEAVVEHNTRHIMDCSDLGIVLFITAGTNPTYISGMQDAGGTACIHTFELPFALWDDSVRNGVRLVIPECRQLSADSFPVHRKTRNRLIWLLADRAARRAKAGSRALLLDENDHITETSSACFFAVIDGVLVTPKSGVLRSLSGRIVHELCDRIGLRFRAGDIPVSRINDLQEAFLSSTPCGLLPVATIDDVRLPGSAEGTIVRQLQREWTQLTSVDTFQQILTQSSDGVSP